MAERGEGSWGPDSGVHLLCSLSLSLAPEGEGNLALGVLYSSGINGGPVRQGHLGPALRV